MLIDIIQILEDQHEGAQIVMDDSDIDDSPHY